MPLGQIDGVEQGMLLGELHNAVSIGSVASPGWTIVVRNQFFHGTRPLGWFGWVAVELDGMLEPPERTFLVLRGQWIRADQMATIRDIYWYKGEAAQIFVESNDAVPAGTHLVRCRIGTSVQAHTRAVDTAGLKARGEVELSGDVTVAETDRSEVLR